MDEAAEVTAVNERVRAISKGGGLRRRALAASLGGGLCLLWGINPDATDLETMRDIARRFERMIRTTPDDSDDGWAVISGLLSFNISTLTRGRRLGYTARREFLSKPWRKKKGLPEPDVGNRSKGSVITATEKVYAHMAEVIWAEWKQEFPNEPYPRDLPPQTTDDALEEEADLDAAYAEEVQVGAEGIPVVASSIRRLSRRKLIASASAAAAVVVGATALLAFHPWSRATATTPPRANQSAVSSPSVIGPSSVASADTGPVHVGAISYVRDGSGPAGWSFIFPRPLDLSASDLTSLNATDGASQDYVNWSLAKGGVTPDDARLSIDLHGNARQSVTVNDLQIVKQCQAPLTGSLLYSPPAGPTGDLSLVFDLDKQLPIAESYQNGKAAGSYFAQGGNGHTIHLAPGETQTLLVDAITSRQDCQYYFTLIIDTGNGEVAETINDNGKPFQVTAMIYRDETTLTPKFSDYQEVYGGGVANPTGNNAFVKVDPNSYKGY